MTIAASVSDQSASSATRWWQLIFGIISMIMIANLQYGWTYFVDPIDAKYHWGRADIQVAFTTFVLLETWLVPVEGWFVDRFGPRVVVTFGGVVVALAWTLNAYADSLPLLYIAAALSGIGAGAVYGTCVGNALKWFADKRGLAAGLTAAGFGAGAAATVYPIITTIQTYGYEKAFLWFGLGQGLVILVLSQLLRAPGPDEAPKAAPRLTQSKRDYTPGEIFFGQRFSWRFWEWAIWTSPFLVMYVMFVLVAASGLVVTAQVAPIARDYKIAGTSIDLLFISTTVLVLAGIVDNVLNGLARPTFGWISDKIGRENTMAIVFTVGAAAYWGLGTVGNTPWTFVVTAGLVYFTWGEIYSLFPATCTDSYGAKFATTNAGLLYTAKGTASLLVPAASLLQNYTGSWHAVFVVATIMNLAVAALALFVLRPMRERALLADEGRAHAPVKAQAPTEAQARAQASSR